MLPKYASSYFNSINGSTFVFCPLINYNIETDKYTTLYSYEYQGNIYFTLKNSTHLSRIGESDELHNPMFHKTNTAWERVRKLQNKQNNWEHNTTFVKQDSNWRRVTV
jgi:hypothetical protein